MQRDFKGVWIPKEIWLNENLSHTEKFLLIEINSLENINGCYATNDHFSKLLGVTKDRISKLLTSLRRKGYITIEIIYKENTKEIEKRILKTQLQNEQEQQEPLGEDTYTPSSKHLYPLGEDTYTPIGENTYENNTVLEIQENNIITPLTPLGENKHQNPNQKPKKTAKRKTKRQHKQKRPPATAHPKTRNEARATTRATRRNLPRMAHLQSRKTATLQTHRRKTPPKTNPKPPTKP